MKSYLKFLSRNKLYTVIEAVGLAVSLAFVILIGSYVVQQYRMAHENPAWNRIYVPGTDSFAGLGYWDKEEIEMSLPEVETISRMSLMQSSAVEYAGRKWPSETGELPPPPREWPFQPPPCPNTPDRQIHPCRGHISAPSPGFRAPPGTAAPRNCR